MLIRKGTAGRRKERRIPSGHFYRDSSVSRLKLPRMQWLVVISPQYLQRKQCQPNWANTKNYIVRNQESEKLKISILLTENRTITHHTRTRRCNTHRVYYFTRFLKTLTINAVLDSWKTIISGIVSQVQLKWKYKFRDSDQYPILCSSDQYALILSNIHDKKWRARIILNTLLAAQHQQPRREPRDGLEFEGFATSSARVAQRAWIWGVWPGPWIFPRFLTLQFNFQCHEIV